MCRSHSSLTWAEMRAATHRILPAYTRKDWLPYRMSAGMSCPKLAPILLRPARGTTDEDRRTAISAHGRLMFRWLHSATAPSGRFRVSGRTTLTTPARGIPIVPGNADASTGDEHFWLSGRNAVSLM